MFKSTLATATAFINANYKSLGGLKGFLGKALTSVKPGRDKKGYVRHFKGGSIYWSWTTGAHELHGLIRVKWVALKCELGFLGYPTSDETIGRDLAKEGRFSHFQRGSIYWHPQTGAHEVHGSRTFKKECRRFSPYDYSGFLGLRKKQIPAIFPFFRLIRRTAPDYEVIGR